MNRTTALLASAMLALSACSGVPQQPTTTFVQPSPSGLVTQPNVLPQAASVQPQRGSGFSVAPPNAPSGPAVDQFARSFLNGIQARSIAEGREYCGYIFIDGNGRLQGTPPRRGRLASCDMPEPLVGQGIIASYHTHGSFNPGFDNEVPSVIDLRSDFDYGIDGYVSTPGGRVWLVDFQTRSTVQVCGLRCVTSDTAFRPIGEARIQQSYTLDGLRRRNAGFSSQF